MKKPDLQYLGEFIKLFSFKGEIILYSDNTISLIENLDTIFIDIDGAFVPFQIKKSKSHKKIFLEYCWRVLVANLKLKIY